MLFSFLLVMMIIDLNFKILFFNMIVDILLILLIFFYWCYCCCFSYVVIFFLISLILLIMILFKLMFYAAVILVILLSTSLFLLAIIVYHYLVDHRYAHVLHHLSHRIYVQLSCDIVGSIWLCSRFFTLFLLLFILNHQHLYRSFFSMLFSSFQFLFIYY